MTGRPTTYTPETADRICEQLALGRSLLQICKADDMPCMVTVYKWLRQNEEFANNYTRAREDQADTHADELLGIADDPSLDPNDKRVRVDARKWVASKLKPKKYGDRMDLKHAGDPDAPLTIQVVTGIPLPVEKKPGS